MRSLASLVAALALTDVVACRRATGRTTTALRFDNDCISASGGTLVWISSYLSNFERTRSAPAGS